MDALRLFDAEGHARLGRGKGARWDLGPEQLSTLESSGLRLYAEGCSFRGRCELQLVVDAGVVDTVLLEVAPLLLAPPTRAFEALWIYRDDNSNTKALCAAFDLASGLVVQGNTDDRLLKVCLEGSLLRDFWLQDEVQWGYTETPFAYLPVAIHMPRGGLLKTWVRSLLAPDVGYVEPCAAPAYGAPEVSYAYGGNIEAGAAWGEGAPGCIVHGFSPTLGDDEEYANATLEPLRKFFTDNTAQPVIGIDPSWLYIGHVDEMISFAWSPRAPKEIKLLVASPGDGVWLLEDLATKGEKVPALVAQHYGGMVDSLADPTGFTWKDFLEARVTGRDTSLKLFNLELEKHVFGDPNDDDKPGVLEPLLSTLTKAAEEEGLEAPEVVKVPTFFYRVDSEDELALDAIALVPNMVNLVAIDGHLIFPDPLLESFRDALADSEALKAFDFAWIDVFDFLHLDVGGLHCATNTRHVAPEAPKWWEED